MTFQNGHKFGNHDNHRGGRPCSVVDDKLRILAMPALLVIADKLANGTSQQKIDLAKYIIDKFKANLIDVASLKELTVSDRFIDFATDLAARISGFSKGNERRPEIAHNQTSVQAEH